MGLPPKAGAHRRSARRLGSVDMQYRLVIPDKQIIVSTMICAIRNPCPGRREREPSIPDSKARNREKLRFSRARLSFRNDAKLECPLALARRTRGGIESCARS